MTYVFKWQQKAPGYHRHPPHERLPLHVGMTKERNDDRCFMMVEHYPGSSSYTGAAIEALIWDVISEVKFSNSFFKRNHFFVFFNGRWNQ